jgi:hypothetical protein
MPGRSDVGRPVRAAVSSGLESLTSRQLVPRNPYMSLNMISWCYLMLGSSLCLTGKGEFHSLRCSAEASAASRSGTAQRAAAGKTCPGHTAPVAVLLSFDYCVPFDLLLFLRRQENEAGALAQSAIGGVRELVQPSDGLWPVRSPASAAHARYSKLERLPERRPRPSARISKDE